MKLGSYTFHTYFSLVEIQNGMRIPTSETPRRDGVIMGDPSGAEKIIRIEGNLSHATDIRTDWDALKTALMGGRQKFYSHDDRFIWATPQSLPDSYDPGLFKHLAHVDPRAIICVCIIPHDGLKLAERTIGRGLVAETEGPL